MEHKTDRQKQPQRIRYGAQNGSPAISESVITDNAGVIGEEIRDLRNDQWFESGDRW